MACLIYFFTGKLSLLLAIPPGYATAVWPPSGVALAAVLLIGYQVWPGIFVGSILSNFSNTFDFTTGLTIFHSIAILTSIGVGAVLQAVTGTYLIRRFVGYPNALLKNKELILFFVLGGPVSSIVSSTIGVFTLLFGDVITISQFFVSWGTWWVGDTIGVVVFTPMILIWLGEPKVLWRRRWKSIFIPLCIMFSLVVFIFVQARNWEKQRTQLEFTQETDRISQGMIKNFDSYLVTLYSLKSFFESSGNIGRNEFSSFTRNFLKIHPGIDSLSWNPIVPNSHRNEFEKKGVSDGIPHFEIKDLDQNGIYVPAKTRNEYAPTYYAEPFNSKEKTLGYDKFSSPIEKKAMELARDTGQPAATSAMDLEPGKNDPQNLGVVIYIPIYQFKSPTNQNAFTRQQYILGYLSGGFQLQKMIKEGLASEYIQGIRIRILDTTDVANAVIYDSGDKEEFKVKTNDLLNSNLKKLNEKSSFMMGSRQWRIELSESNNNSNYKMSWISLSILAGGLIFTAFFGIFFFMINSSEARTREQVIAQTLEIRRSEQKFREILDSAPDAIVISNRDGKIEVVNDQAEKMFGYNREELLGWDVENILSETFDQNKSGVSQKFMSSVSIRPSEANVQLYGRRKNGNRFPVEISLNPISANDEDWIAASVRDISKRKEVDDLKNQFMDMISHELRTPLSPIHQFTTILMDGLGGPINDQQKSYLDIILKNTLQMQSIIADLVDVSRMSTGKISTNKEPMDSVEIVRRIVQNFSQTAEKKSIRIEDEVPIQLPRIWADPVRFEQVLGNLIDNAIKYTPANGKIVVKAVSPWEDQTSVCFMVTDTGQGVPKEDQQLIFERLYQSSDQFKSSRKGLGLGLHICKDLVQRHGGKIWVDSVSGQGSTFYFTMPIFTFDSLLKPLLEKDGKAPMTLGLITIHVYTIKKISDDIKNESLKELENYLSHSVLPYDVIIPYKKPNEECFYILVASDEIGVKAVIHRIQSQWVTKYKFGIGELQLNFWYRMLEMPSIEERNTSTDMQIINMISLSVERMIGKLL